MNLEVHSVVLQTGLRHVERPRSGPSEGHQPLPGKGPQRTASARGQRGRPRQPGRRQQPPRARSQPELEEGAGGRRGQGQHLRAGPERRRNLYTGKLNQFDVQAPPPSVSQLEILERSLSHNPSYIT